MVRVLLVDDESAVRRGLHTRLQLEADIEIVGEAATGVEAVCLAQALVPDVVLMDVEMPEMDGIVATAALQALVPQCAIVMLSIYNDSQTRGRAQAAGAFAFVEKRGALDALMAAIRRAAQRE